MTQRDDERAKREAAEAARREAAGLPKETDEEREAREAREEGESESEGRRTPSA